MKLHLPKMLAAALIAASTALIAGQQAQAYSRNITTTTTPAGDTTYNGCVFTMLNGSGNFSGRHFIQAAYNSGQWENTGAEITSGNKDVVTPLGTGWFWTMYCSTATASNGIDYGNTLRLTGATSQQKLATDFSDFAIGGLIADDSYGSSSAGTPAYWFYRGAAMDIVGANDVIMDINSHVRFSYQSNVNMKKGGTWNIHSGKTLTFDNNSSGAATTFNFYENQALTVKGGGTLNLGRSSNGTYNVNMKSGSSLHVTGNSTVNLPASSGTFTANGTITVDEGSTLNIKLTTTLGRTITNNGNIQFASDTVTLSDLGGFDSEGTFVDYSGETGNGFAGTIVYTIIQGTGTTNLAKVVYGTQPAATLSEGKLTVEGATDYTKYYINTNDTTISVKSASEFAAQHESAVLSTVYVKGAGDTVNIDENFNGAIEVSGTNATVNIASGKEFDGTLSGGTLTGSGIYALATGTTSMGAVVIGSDWTGTVRITDASANKLDFSTLVNGTSSTLELMGYSGYPTTWYEDVEGGINAQNIKLTNGSNGYAFNFNGTTSQENHEVTFSGVWSGDGTFKISSNKLNYKITGNISAWSGTLQVASGIPTLTIADNATVVNAAITKDSNQRLYLDVQNSATFGNSVTADSLTMAAEQVVTLKGETSIGTLAGAGSLVVNAAEHTVALRGGAIANTIDLQAGTLSLAGAYNLDAMEPTDYDDEYVGPEEGVAAGSGFHKVSGTISVVNIGSGTLSLAEGATFSYQEASVTVDDKTGAGTFGGVDLTTLWVNGTDPVSYNAAQEYAEQQAPGTIVRTVHLNYDGATITMDRAGASVALVLSEDEEVTSGTVYATADTTISSITGWTGKELVIDGTSTVTTGALALDNNGTKLTVAAGATLDIAGDKHNLTLQHGSATIDGTVTIAHELDLSKGSTSDAVLVIGSTGNVTATDGLWLRGGHHFTILDEGQFTVKGLTFVGMGDESTIGFNDVDTKDGNYATTGDGMDKFVITNMTILANKDVTIGNTLVNSTVVTGDHAVTLNTDATKVIVSDGGTFTKGAGVTVEDITVEDSGTIAGNVEVSEVGITAGSVAAFEQGLPEDSGVTFSNEDAHTPITVENIGMDTIHYDGIGQVDAKVTADNLVFFMAGGPATVDNRVSVGSVQNLYSEGALTLTNVDTDTLREVEAVMSNVVLENVESVGLQKLIISGATVAVYQGDTESAEGMVNIKETLTAGGGTLLANLTLVGTDGHVSLDLSDITAQEGWAALTLGSQFGIAEGTLVTLDAVTISALEGLRIGDSLDLIQALSPDDQLTYLNAAYDGMWFDALFERVAGVKGDYLVYATRESFGLTKVSNVPEPTTGTLSLLALAALAARRRKH
ncbi:MAG: hypothetical protein Q4E43_07670 [Akkermansia sp.]|nr:hypothetical protein [Akkermansia sp.]